MAEEKEEEMNPARVPEGVIKYTKPPENKTPPSQRPAERPKS